MSAHLAKKAVTKYVKDALSRVGLYREGVSSVKIKLVRILRKHGLACCELFLIAPADTALYKQHPTLSLGLPAQTFVFADAAVRAVIKGSPRYQCEPSVSVALISSEGFYTAWTIVRHNGELVLILSRTKRAIAVPLSAVTSGRAVDPYPSAEQPFQEILDALHAMWTEVPMEFLIELALRGHTIQMEYAKSVLRFIHVLGGTSGKPGFGLDKLLQECAIPPKFLPRYFEVKSFKEYSATPKRQWLTISDRFIVITQNATGDTLAEYTLKAPARDLEDFAATLASAQLAESEFVTKLRGRFPKFAGMEEAEFYREVRTLYERGRADSDADSTYSDISRGLNEEITHMLEDLKSDVYVIGDRKILCRILPGLDPSRVAILRGRSGVGKSTVAGVLAARGYCVVSAEKHPRACGETDSMVRQWCGREFVRALSAGKSIVVDGEHLELRELRQYAGACSDLGLVVFEIESYDTPMLWRDPATSISRIMLANRREGRPALILPATQIQKYARGVSVCEYWVELPGVFSADDVQRHYHSQMEFLAREIVEHESPRGVLRCARGSIGTLGQEFFLLLDCLGGYSREDLPRFARQKNFVTKRFECQIWSVGHLTVI